MLHEPLDPGALLGHCGATSYGVSDCKGGSQGSFGLDFRHGHSTVLRVDSQGASPDIDPT